MAFKCAYADCRKTAEGKSGKMRSEALKYGHIAIFRNILSEKSKKTKI